jgi:hypothetical protein
VIDAKNGIPPVFADFTPPTLGALTVSHLVQDFLVVMMQVACSDGDVASQPISNVRFLFLTLVIFTAWYGTVLRVYCLLFASVTSFSHLFACA